MRRSPRQARFLGLWTAAWLFALLLALLLRFGDLSLQWPALLVPVGWALGTWARTRDGRRPARRRYGEPEDDDVGWAPDDKAWPADDEAWPADDEPRTPADRPARRPAPTEEAPWLPDVPRDRGRGFRREE